MQANLTPQKIELMDRYLDHELSDMELELFEKELSSDPAMLRELRDYTVFRDKLSHVAAHREMPFTRQDPLEYGFRQERSTKLKIVLLLRLIIGLLVLIAVCVAFLIISGRQELFEVLLHPFKK